MSNAIPQYSFFSYRVFAGQLETLSPVLQLNKQLLISTINPHSFYVADQDKDFKMALEQSQVLLPDGIGIVYANWLINRSALRKISGMDLFLFLLRKLNEQKEPAVKRIFFLGSTDEILKLIQVRIEKEFPSLSVGSYSPPYKPAFNEEDSRAMINAVNAFAPHVLFVGMTAPKQEKWSYANREHLNVRVICSIGAVFDFYSGNIIRPGKLWQALGLEWLGRFLMEPRRLWKRSLVSLPYFVSKVLQEVLKRGFTKGDGVNHSQ